MRVGSPRITRQLKKEGFKCFSRPRVARIMRKNGIKAVYASGFKKTATNSDIYDEYPPNLHEQDFSADKINQVWISDITYIKTINGFMYLAVVNILTYIITEKDYTRVLITIVLQNMKKIFCITFCQIFCCNCSLNKLNIFRKTTV